MQIDSIRHFIELADAGSFYQAAGRAHLTAQGFHKMLGSLEGELGVSLMNRTSSGLTLTPEGRAFLSSAHTIVDAYTSMLDDVYAAHAGSSHHGEPEMIPAYCTNLTMQAVSWATVDADTLRSFNLTELPLRKLLQEVMEPHGESLTIAELGPATLGRLRQNRNLVIRPLYRTQIGIVTLKVSPLADRAPLLPEHLTDTRMAIPQHAEFQFLLNSALGGAKLREIQLISDNLKMRIEFARMNPDKAVVWDAFTFYLLEKNGPFPLEDLVFTPLESPNAPILICSLGTRSNLPSSRVAHLLDSFVLKVHRIYSDYFERYPLSRTPGSK